MSLLLKRFARRTLKDYLLKKEGFWYFLRKFLNNEMMFSLYLNKKLNCWPQEWHGSNIKDLEPVKNNVWGLQVTVLVFFSYLQARLATILHSMKIILSLFLYSNQCFLFFFNTILMFIHLLNIASSKIGLPCQQWDLRNKINQSVFSGFV